MTQIAEPERKGRGNAILTYETVAEIDKKLTEVSTTVVQIKEAVREGNTKHLDHEVRIRALEITTARDTAALAATKSTGSWIWSAILGVGALAVSVAAYFK